MKSLSVMVLYRSSGNHQRWRYGTTSRSAESSGCAAMVSGNAITTASVVVVAAVAATAEAATYDTPGSPRRYHAHGHDYPAVSSTTMRNEPPEAADSATIRLARGGKSGEVCV